MYACTNGIIKQMTNCFICCLDIPLQRYNSIQIIFNLNTNSEIERLLLFLSVKACITRTNYSSFDFANVIFYEFDFWIMFFIVNTQID